jgi:hypothetical protein
MVKVHVAPAVILARNVEPMEVGPAPGKDHQGEVIQLSDCSVTKDYHTAPDQRANAAEDDAKLVDTWRANDGQFPRHNRRQPRSTPSGI